MKRNAMSVTVVFITGFLLVQPVLAAESAKVAKVAAEDIKKDIANHRVIAEAHANAAACLESGKTENVCHAQLQKDCKGVGIGKYCGMKHQH